MTGELEQRMYLKGRVAHDLFDGFAKDHYRMEDVTEALDWWVLEVDEIRKIHKEMWDEFPTINPKTEHNEDWLNAYLDFYTKSQEWFRKWSGQE